MDDKKFHKYLDGVGIAVSTTTGLLAGFIANNVIANANVATELAYVVVPPVAISSALLTELGCASVIDKIVDWRKNRAEQERLVTALTKAEKEPGKYYVLELDNQMIDYIQESYRDSKGSSLEVNIYNKKRTLGFRIWAECQVLHDKNHDKTYVVVEPRINSSAELFYMRGVDKYARIEAEEASYKNAFLYDFGMLANGFKEGVIPETYLHNNSVKSDIENLSRLDSPVLHKEEVEKSVSLKPKQSLQNKSRSIEL